jgi:predicted nucleic acid-binding protein
MSQTVLLDSGPLGLVTNPKGSPEAIACAQWLKGLTDEGVTIYVPEIADYEVRRELLRAGKLAGLSRLDALIASLTYLPITTEMMRQAAAFWADARRRGRQTAADPALDADVILAAQAITLRNTLGLASEEIVVASGNTRHLVRFVNADTWRNIAP